MEAINDLTDLGNEGIKHLADYLFTSISGDVVLQFDADMIDMFCGSTELVLYGIDILCDGSANIFDLRTVDDPIINTLQEYLKRMGLRLWIKEEESDNCLKIISLEEPITNPLDYDIWEVLNYQMMSKKYFIKHTDLVSYSASFEANNKLFSFGFKML